jgi:hypothetical protein
LDDVCHKIPLNEKGDKVESLKAEGDLRVPEQQRCGRYITQTTILAMLGLSISSYENDERFSKKLKNSKAAVTLYFAWYNFCRVH